MVGGGPHQPNTHTHRLGRMSGSGHSRHFERASILGEALAVRGKYEGRGTDYTIVLPSIFRLHPDPNMPAIPGTLYSMSLIPVLGSASLGSGVLAGPSNPKALANADAASKPASCLTFSSISLTSVRFSKSPALPTSLRSTSRPTSLASSSVNCWRKWLLHGLAS
jgi:hypothetical protein